MKGFLVFLSIVTVVLSLFLYYKIMHPTETMMVRNGAYWTVFEHNMSR